MSIIITNKNTPYWLAKADIFVGDMSDLTYEALILDIPILQFENKWIKDNFPVVGERFKTGSELYQKLSAMMSQEIPIGTSLKYSNIIDNVIDCPSNSEGRILTELSSTFSLPNVNFEFHHLNNHIYKEILFPILDQIKKYYPKYTVIDTTRSTKLINKPNFRNVSLICHVETSHILKNDDYIIHIGHGLKGDGTAFLGKSIELYRSNNHFIKIDKFYVAGKMGKDRLTNVLGVGCDRISIVGYAKITKLIQSRRKLQKRKRVSDKITILYGPAGIREPDKPGGSVTISLLYNLIKVGLKPNVCVVIKVKSYKHFARQIINLLRKF
jgi:hypothetical protein